MGRLFSSCHPFTSCVENGIFDLCNSDCFGIFFLLACGSKSILPSLKAKADLFCFLANKIS